MYNMFRKLTTILPTRAKSKFLLNLTNETDYSIDREREKERESLIICFVIVIISILLASIQVWLETMELQIYFFFFLGIPTGRPGNRTGRVVFIVIAFLSVIYSNVFLSLSGWYKTKFLRWTLKNSKRYSCEFEISVDSMGSGDLTDTNNLAQSEKSIERLTA